MFIWSNNDNELQLINFSILRLPYFNFYAQQRVFFLDNCNIAIEINTFIAHLS